MLNEKAMARAKAGFLGQDGAPELIEMLHRQALKMNSSEAKASFEFDTGDEKPGEYVPYIEIGIRQLEACESVSGEVGDG